MKLLLIILTSLSLSTFIFGENLQAVKCTVINEDNTPVIGAQIAVGYVGHTPKSSKSVKGITNPAGVFTANGHAPLRMKVIINKDGYYTSVIKKLNRSKDHDLKIVLRKKLKPIPLLAKRIRTKIPSIGKKHGFDFKIGDWIKPFGKGITSDILIEATWEKNSTGKNIGNLSITAPDDEDGIFVTNSSNGFIHNSSLQMPHTAPIKGYIKEIKRSEIGYENIKKPVNTSYFIKTRAKDINTADLQFNYAKILNGIDFFMSGGVFLSEEYRKKHPKELGVITFSYCFNPTPDDRNLEFDITRNLFDNLKSIEKVREP